jgi:hypothetical protein
MRMAWIVAAATLVSGCAGEADSDEGTSETASTSGDDVGSDDGGYAGSCEYRPSVLPDIDAVGLVGISARELLARAEGTYTGELSWIENLASHANAGTQTPVEIEVMYAGGEIRDIDAELVAPCLHDGPCPCEDRLEVDVNVRIVSTDGALDEQMVIALQYAPTDDYFGSGLPHFYHRFDPDASPGGLETSDIDIPEDTTLREVFLTADFDDGTCGGSFNVEIEMGPGIGAGPFASFTATTDSTD